MAFALGEDGNEHVGAGHLFAAGRLDMDDRALDDALEAGGRLGVLVITGDQVGEFVIDIFDERLAQRVEVDVAGAHDGGRIGVVDQGEQQMLERRIFVMPLVGKGQCLMERLLKTRRKCWHVQILTSFP